MIRRRMNPAGTYAGLSNLVLISGLPGTGYPQGQRTQATSSDARTIRAETSTGRTDDAQAPASLGSAAI
jgi:hypothetical protein